MSIRAALHRFDPSLEEAARSLGDSGWQTFLRITLPNLRPAITAGGLLVALYTLSDFGAVSLLRFNSFTRAIFVQYLSSFDRSLASLLSLALNSCLRLYFCCWSETVEGAAAPAITGAALGLSRLATALNLQTGECLR